MKYVKSLALLLSISSISILTSCSEYEDFPAEVYSTMETKATEPTDSTGSGKITLLIDEPDVEDLNYEITLP